MRKGSRPFVLDGKRRSFHSTQYEPLTDKYLSFYFRRCQVKQHLRRSKIVNRSSHIVSPEIKKKVLRRLDFPLCQFMSRKLSLNELAGLNREGDYERRWVLQSGVEKESGRRFGRSSASKQQQLKRLSSLADTMLNHGCRLT